MRISEEFRAIQDASCISGDLTELQTALARFVAAARVYLKYPLDPRWMLQLLTDIENAWMNFTLTREEEMWLAEKFTAMQGEYKDYLKKNNLLQHKNLY